MRNMDESRKDDFFEADESPEKIKAAFDRATQWTTPRVASGQIEPQAGLYEHLSSGLSRLSAQSRSAPAKWRTEASSNQ